MDIEIKLWAVLAASLMSFVVGFIWYMPNVFGERWRKLIKMDKKTMDKGPGLQGWVMATAGALLQAYVLAHVTYLSYRYFGDADSTFEFWEAALSTALWMWLGFQLAMILTHDSFERRPIALTLLTAGNQLVTLLAMGAIIALLGN